jgi:hypothetical protein
VGLKAATGTKEGRKGDKSRRAGRRAGGRAHLACGRERQPVLTRFSLFQRKSARSDTWKWWESRHCAIRRKRRVRTWWREGGREGGRAS